MMNDGYEFIHVYYPCSAIHLLLPLQEHSARKVQCIQEGCGLVFATRQEMFEHYPVHVEDGDID